jgi:hypothetical protein
MQNYKPCLLFCLIAFGSLFQQDKSKKEQDEQKAIDKAVQKGCEYLLKNIQQAYEGNVWGQQHMGDSHAARAELVLLALIHGEAFNEKKEDCKKLLDFVLEWRPKFTYRAALKAMALQALDPKKYIEFIAECGQFLVNAQDSVEGHWHYGGPPMMKNPWETQGIDKPKIHDYKTPKKKIKLAREGSNRNQGCDHSNTQYAVLGLRAVMECGIEVPKEVLQLGKKWWEKAQFPNGHWRYHGAGGGIATSGTGLQLDNRLNVQPDNLTRSRAMTAGGVSSLAIYKFFLGECKKKDDLQKDPAISGGIKWLSDNFDLLQGGIQEGNPDHRDGLADFYWLYSLERAGVLSSTDVIGKKDWYKEGVKWLLTNQKSDGRWGCGICDTCFAILFLRKATEPIATH